MQEILKLEPNAQKEEIEKIANEVFGIHTLFPYQWLVIMSILDGKDSDLEDNDTEEGYT